MTSVRLMLIFDDVELGIGLARIATLCLRLGDLLLARQSQSDAEDCLFRAESLRAGLAPEEKTVAESSLRKLRNSILAISKTGTCTDFDVNDGTLLAN